MIGALWLLPEDNILDKLFLFHSGVATTLGGLLPGVVVPVGGDGDDVVLPPLGDGDEGSGGRSTGDLMAPVSSPQSSSSWPYWWATPCTWAPPCPWARPAWPSCPSFH